MFTIDIADEQASLEVDEDALRRAVEAVLQGEGVPAASISLAVVDDEAMRRLHREYLGIDTPTDVLSFVLSDAGGALEGEIIVSADTARTAAGRFPDWSPERELLLYAVHGTLHLAGYDDIEDADRAEMRRREREYMGRLGLSPPYDEAEAASSPRGEVGKGPHS